MSRAEEVPRNYDRVAREYDETRGGQERAENAAGDVVPHLVPGQVLEIGVGTGTVAEAVGRALAGQVQVVGVDISRDMLAMASARLSGRLIRASALRLPFPEASFDDVVAVHVLHLVTDLTRTLTEGARVLRPGGRLVAVHGAIQQPDDEFQRATLALRELRGARPDTPEHVRSVAEAAGLRCLVQHASSPQVARHTPAELADLIERRSWSFLWSLDGTTWRERIEPAIHALRTLPDQHRPRPQEGRVTVTVLERP